MQKKLIALLLAVAMVLSLCPAAFAAADDFTLPQGAVEVSNGFYQSAATYDDATGF